jgi:1-acyl-sn-glycerol-3-phosphate acyltransferase
MGDLQVSTDSSPLPVSTPAARDVPAIQRFFRRVWSVAFFTLYFTYLILYVGLVQRVIIWPLTWLLPRRRDRIVGAWVRHNGRATVALCRTLANVHISIHGEIPPGSCVVLMNHQSVLDIAIGLSLTPPAALIPTRERYRRGLPGISPMTRIARFPMVSQKRIARKSELLALARTAESVANGTHSLLIFPEGHRSDTGDIGPFMTSGLELILARARRPVYCIVGDGMSHVRTFQDAILNFTGSHITVQVVGPFEPPSDRRQLVAFIDSMRARMVAMLNDLRAVA